VSEFTHSNLKGVYRSREIDRVIVKGKTKPVGIYEVLDFHTADTFPNIMEVLNYFKDGLEKYRVGDWDPAIKSFKEGKFHIKLILISDELKLLKSIDANKKIFAVLKGEMNNYIHSLQIKIN